MAETAQLNARIDRELKASGDAALALIGLSPSQAVRALWEKAARRGEDLEQVEALLAPTSRVEDKAAPPEAKDPVGEGWTFMETAYASLGINADTVRDYPDDQMLEDALFDRMAQRELA